MNSPAVRIGDYFPDKILEQPYDDKAFYENVVRFVALGAPVGIGIGVSFIAGIALWNLAWYAGAILFCVGVLLACVFKIVYEAYKASAGDLDTRRLEHTKTIDRVLILIQSLTINQTVNVKSGATFNSGVPANESPTARALGDVYDPLNEVYDLATEMVKIAVGAWNANSGKRPRPKPFSAQMITEQFRVGRDKWTEAIQMIEDAKAINKPNEAMWTPLVKTPEEGIGKLDKHMTSLGYYRNRTSTGKESWMK